MTDLGMTPPSLSKAEKAREKDLKTFPKDVLERSRIWEGFPGFGWMKVGTNARVLRLKALDGPQDELNKTIKELQLFYLEAKDSTSTTLALIAGVGASALAIPGIETTHSITRALLTSSTLLALCGVLTGTMMPGIFQIFFGEDLAASSNPSSSCNHIYLSLKNNRKLLHRVDKLFAQPTIGITLSGLFFMMGMICFVLTAEFGATAILFTPRHSAWFLLTALLPCVIYMGNFWASLYTCCNQHRNIRNNNKNKYIFANTNNYHPTQSGLM